MVWSLSRGYRANIFKINTSIQKSDTFGMIARFSIINFYIFDLDFFG
jgi:hypothetical protein